VLVVGVAALDVGASAGQVVGVCLVGAGVLLVRGLAGRHDPAGLALGLAIAGVIAAYTLLDKRGIRYADPVVYLELGMAPASIAYLAAVASFTGGRERIRRALRPVPVTAGVLSFVAYALVLAALALADAASVAAVRETSVLIAAGLAAWLLGERVGRARAVGAALIVAGVALVALR
jgi:drug/metabolite transporter (DMT)-like permease